MKVLCEMDSEKSPEKGELLWKLSPEKVMVALRGSIHHGICKFTLSIWHGDRMSHLMSTTCHSAILV